MRGPFPVCWERSPFGVPARAISDLLVSGAKSAPVSMIVCLRGAPLATAKGAPVSSASLPPQPRPHSPVSGHSLPALPRTLTLLTFDARESMCSLIAALRVLRSHLRGEKG
jgi:hypothetical protein